MPASGKTASRRLDLRRLCSLSGRWTGPARQRAAAESPFRRGNRPKCWTSARDGTSLMNWCPWVWAFWWQSPRFGKSWMILDLCLAVAAGEPFLNLPTHQHGTLYLALERWPQPNATPNQKADGRAAGARRTCTRCSTRRAWTKVSTRRSGQLSGRAPGDSSCLHRHAFQGQAQSQTL